MHSNPAEASHNCLLDANPQSNSKTRSQEWLTLREKFKSSFLQNKSEALHVKRPVSE